MYVYFEYIAVAAIVACALWYAGRDLWRQTHAKGCENCNCSRKKMHAVEQVVNIDTPENSKN